MEEATRREMERQQTLQSKLNELKKAGVEIKPKKSAFQEARENSSKKMKEGFANFKEKTIGRAGKALGGLKDRVANTGIARGVGSAVGKVGAVASGIGGAIGKVMKVLGPIGIVVTLIGAMLKKSQKFQDFVKKIQEKIIEPIMKQIGAIFDQIDFDGIADVLCSLLPPVLKVISWALKPIVWILNLIASGIKKILGWLNISVNTEQQISENSADPSNPMKIEAHTDGAIRTHNASNGESSSSSDSSSSTVSKPKNSSDTKVESSGGGLFGGLANTLIKATPFGALSTAVEQFGGVAKEFIEMKKEQNNSPAKQQALADSIRMGIDGATLEIKDGKDSSMAVLNCEMFKQG